MDDLISRQAAIDAIRASTSKYTGFMEMEMYTDDDAVEAIISLPSAQQWIPVTERLPENFERVIVWMSWGGFSMMDFQLEHFYPLNSVHPVPDEAVTAWMPLPEPYREEAIDG